MSRTVEKHLGSLRSLLQDVEGNCGHIRDALAQFYGLLEDGLWEGDVEAGVAVVMLLCGDDVFSHADARLQCDVLRCVVCVSLTMLTQLDTAAAEVEKVAVVGMLQHVIQLLAASSRHRIARVRCTAIKCAKMCAQHTSCPFPSLLSLLELALPRMHDPATEVREAALACLLFLNQRVASQSSRHAGLLHNEMLSRLLFVVRDPSHEARVRCAQLLSTCVSASRETLLCGLASEEWVEGLQNERSSLDCVGLMHLALEDDSADVRRIATTSMRRLGCYGGASDLFLQKCMDSAVDVCNDESEEVRMAALSCVCEWSRGRFIGETLLRVVLDSLADTPNVLRIALCMCACVVVSDLAMLKLCAESILAVLTTPSLSSNFETAWQVMAKIGSSHPHAHELASSLLPPSGSVPLTQAAQKGIYLMLTSSEHGLSTLPTMHQMFLQAVDDAPHKLYEAIDLECPGQEAQG